MGGIEGMRASACAKVQRARRRKAPWVTMGQQERMEQRGWNRVSGW